MQRAEINDISYKAPVLKKIEKIRHIIICEFLVYDKQFINGFVKYYQFTYTCDLHAEDYYQGFWYLHMLIGNGSRMSRVCLLIIIQDS